MNPACTLRRLFRLLPALATLVVTACADGAVESGSGESDDPDALISGGPTGAPSGAPSLPPTYDPNAFPGPGEANAEPDAAAPAPGTAPAPGSAPAPPTDAPPPVAEADADAGPLDPDAAAEAPAPVDPPPADPPPADPPPADPPPADPPDDPVPPGGAGCGAFEEIALVDALNAARVAAGAAAVVCDAQVRQAAAAHTADMCARDYFDVAAPDGTDPGARLQAAGLDPEAWAVSIAGGGGDPNEVQAQWNEQPPDALAGDLTRVGVSHDPCNGRHLWARYVVR